jgi:DNA-binding transcriptional LysR family regulator
VEVDVLLCEIGGQGELLRNGSADVAIVHAPFDVLSGLETVEIVTEGQVAIVPAVHPLARRTSLTMAEVSDVPDLPIARWPLHDGSYPPGRGPEVRSQSQLAQLVALGRTLLVIPGSSRAWQWPDHVAVPVTDAPDVTTLLAWPAGHRSPALDDLVDTATRLAASASAP